MRSALYQIPRKPRSGIAHGEQAEKTPCHHRTFLYSLRRYEKGPRQPGGSSVVFCESPGWEFTQGRHAGMSGLSNNRHLCGPSTGMARTRSLDLVWDPSVSLRALPNQILPVGTPGPASSYPPSGCRDADSRARAALGVPLGDQGNDPPARETADHPDRRDREPKCRRCVCARLPAEAPVGCRVQVTVDGAEIRSGTVRWVKPQEGAWFSHGVGFDAPAGRRGMVSPQVRRFRRRQRVRRMLFWLVTLGVIAVTAAGLVWLMDGLRNYQPQYYEPKDIERERHETQRRLENANPPPSR